MHSIRQSVVVAFMGCAAVALPAPRGLASAQAAQTGQATFLVVPFAAPSEPGLGVAVAEGVRQRLRHLFPIGRDGRTTLRIITRDTLNHHLEQNGFQADSAIATDDLGDLGRELHATESMEGTVTRTATGVAVKARVYSRNNISSSEVLSAVEARDAAAAGATLADEYVRARMELPDYERCHELLSTNDLDAAVTAARTSIKQFERGVLPRTCLMQAFFKLYLTKRLPPDSAMRTAQQILAIDPDNEKPLGILADLYLTQGDTAKGMEMNIRLARKARSTRPYPMIDGPAHSHFSLMKQVAVVRDLVSANPRDTMLLKIYWQLSIAAQLWKATIAAGEAMIAVDSALADSNFFNRQIAAAIADTQPALVLKYLARATVKYPRSTLYWLGYSQELRRQGRPDEALAAAKQAIAIDPKVPNGYPMVLSLLAATSHNADSGMAIARMALAAGADRDAIGNALLTVLVPTTREKPPNWQRLYALSSLADSLVPQPATAFYVALAAFNLADDILRTASELAKTDTARACSRLKEASDYVRVVKSNLRRGSFDTFRERTFGDDLTARVKPGIENTTRELSCR